MTSARQKESICMLKLRIEDLEQQVAGYKKRLDELRKAKNTTIVKRERKVLEVYSPTLGRRDHPDRRYSLDARLVALQNKFDENEAIYKAEIEDLQKQLKHKVESSSKRSSQETSSCGHAEIIMVLQSENSAVLMENEELRERIANLNSELSVKEATWCDQEEKLKLKVKMDWGEQYAQWMAQTEQKLGSLQEANTTLQQLLEHRNPSQQDPQ